MTGQECIIIVAILMGLYYGVFFTTAITIFKKIFDKM